MSQTTPASMTATSQEAVVRRHPIRGFLWGLLMGIGLTLVLVLTKVIGLDLTMMIVVTAIAVLVGVLWSTVAPAKPPKGPPPATVTVAGAPEPSRFDDFEDARAAGTTAGPDADTAITDTGTDTDTGTGADTDAPDGAGDAPGDAADGDDD